MSYAQLIEKLRSLPSDKQVEVFDFVEFLSARFGDNSELKQHHDWTDAEFSFFLVGQALRGMEDEPEIYSQEDLKERWR